MTLSITGLILLILSIGYAESNRCGPKHLSGTTVLSDIYFTTKRFQFLGSAL